jgi:8-oxo-dGTP diphosphatase
MCASKSRERPAVTVDVAAVAPMEGRLKVLLVRRGRPPFEGCWALPGGFVEANEALEAAARRELREETGAEPAHLEQLHTFGDPGRDPRGWTISVVYLARLGEEHVQAWQPQAGSDAGEVGWFDLDDPPPLAFDHAEILAYAARHLREKRIAETRVTPAPPAAPVGPAC